MCENQASDSVRDLLNTFSCSVDANKNNSLNECSNVFPQTLVSDPEHIHKMNELFNSAEYWLNYQGIKTRTEYGNLLPTYNLFLEIGEWLEKKLTPYNNE